MCGLNLKGKLRHIIFSFTQQVPKGAKMMPNYISYWLWLMLFVAAKQESESLLKICLNKGYLVDDVVFLGGCTAGLLITDPAAPYHGKPMM